MEVLILKKIFISTFVVLALVLSYSINSCAFAGTDITIHTRASVSDFFSETPYSNIVKNIYSWTGNSFNFTPTIIYNKLNNLPSGALGYDNYFLTFDSDGYLVLTCYNGASFGCINNTGYQSQVYYDDVRSGWTAYIPCVNGGYSFSVYRCNWGNSDNWSGQGYTYADSNDYHASTFGGVLLSTNMPLYYFDELNMKSIPHSGVISENLYSHPEIYDLMTDFNNGLPYVDGDGNIVDPTPVVESNANHMYFKDCEIGFCYPKSSPAPVSFGGAYFYIKYTVDDWIVNHISDYNLVFYADAEVGNDVTNTIRYEVALDPDGCITIPFSRVWSTPLTSKGFSVLVTDREIEDNFYKAYLYSLSPSGFVNFGDKAAASNQNSISGALNALTSGGIQSFLYYINGDQIDFYSAMSEVATSIAVKYNPYLITAFTLLTDGTDNSGLFEMEFDLVAGTEDVTDTGGLVNPDPFVPEDDPDFTPPAPTPGNSTTPGYNIVPSGFWQGTMNAIIGYDPGYRDLKADLDKDPDDNFTQYLAPFKNNEVGGFVGDFLDDMPTALKSIFIGGFGVLTLLGIYRFIRRG